MPDRRAHAREIFSAALAAVEPAAAVLAQVRVADGRLHAGGRSFALDGGRIVVVGMGKACAAMAQAIEQLLGARVSGGVVITKYGHGAPLSRLRLCESAHPVPDEAGVRAATLLEESLRGLQAQDLVICLLSGGASALMPAPRPGISLADKQAVARLLLGSGADITAMNTVRKKLSRLKGGGLVRACAPARLLCLAISDVIGDDWSIIGSGPTSPDPSTFADAWAVVERFAIAERLPPAVFELLQRGLAGAEAETLKPGDPALARVTNLLLASNQQAVAAAAACATRLGYQVTTETQPMQGEARAQGEAFLERVLAAAQAGPQPRCRVAGGETTVTLGATPGLGGRNQELALAVAVALAGRGAAPLELTLLAGGTDGTDGPTDAAGGIVDRGTVARAMAAGEDAQAALQGHDAYHLLRSSGDLLITGPTGTNVMDLLIGLSAG